jgi:hypothetical protein
MLGGERSRTYLLALQNLSAPRGTGGFLGFYGSLTATNGTVELDELTASSTVPEVRPVDVPADAARLYSRFGVRTTFWAANYSPDVPTSSTIALEIAEEAGLGSFDGVIWTDTVWLASMLGAVGPVNSKAWAEPLTADNLVDVLNRQTFLETSAMRSDDLQARIGLDVWDALLTRPADAVELASIMADATASGHFTAFSTTSNEESLLADLGADGAFEPGSNPFTVIWQDAGATRAAFFAEKRAATEIALGADGTAQVATTVTLNNGAPDGPPSILLGTGGGSPPIGWMGLDVEVYLPEGASEPQIETSEASVYSVQRAFDRRVGGCFLYGDPGDEMTCTLSYAAPDAATPVDDGWEYRMQIQPQPSLAPMPVSVTVQIPDGSEIEEMPPGASVDGTTVTWTGAPAEPTTLVFRYA